MPARSADADLTSAVIADVEAELAAVEHAELGDLSGRAAQAVQLTRQDASPVQVAVADQILAKNPLGADELFLELDPTSACVAAAHWLQAAANVVSGISGVAATDVVIEADNIQALPHATPTAVLELMEIGMSPTAAVTTLIRHAMAVAEGDVPDLDDLREKIDDAEENAGRYGQGNPEAVAEFMRIRLTTLDPGRPARDMLEDLLSGVRGCWLLYPEYARPPTRTTRCPTMSWTAPSTPRSATRCAPEQPPTGNALTCSHRNRSLKQEAWSRLHSDWSVRMSGNPLQCNPDSIGPPLTKASSSGTVGHMRFDLYLHARAAVGHLDGTGDRGRSRSLSAAGTARSADGGLTRSIVSDTADLTLLLGSSAENKPPPLPRQRRRRGDGNPATYRSRGERISRPAPQPSMLVTR